MKIPARVTFALMLAVQALLWVANVYWWTTPTNVLERRGHGDLATVLFFGGSAFALALAVTGIAKRRGVPLFMLIVQQASSWPLAAFPLAIFVLVLLSGATV